MELAGRPSWRFTEDLSDLLHRVLFVRDALRLPVDDAPDVPPPLRDVPDRSAELDDATRAGAGAQWTAWWRAAVAHDAGVALGVPGPGAQARLRHLAAARLAVADPPQWQALQATPALRAAARAAFADGGGVRADHLRSHLGSGRSAAAFGPRARAVAEALAAEHGPERVSGAVSVLLVQGIWWQVVAPGFALCSVAAAEHPDVAEAALRAVLTPPRTG